MASLQSDYLSKQSGLGLPGQLLGKYIQRLTNVPL